MAHAPFSFQQQHMIDRYAGSGHPPQRLTCCKSELHTMGRAYANGVRCETCGELHTIVPDCVFVEAAPFLWPTSFLAPGVH